MKRVFYLFLLLLVFYNIYLCSALVRSGEVNFFNDVARDFLLFQELDTKKIVLIGARSSTIGLFHGPLWSYMNYPAYLLGNGNPVTVAWFWIVLACIFLLTSFLMVRKLFGTLSAFAFILLTSIFMVPHINGVFHAEATFFFMPFFFFTICMYLKNKKALSLAIHLLSLAILIQLEVGVGMQLFILSTIVILWFIARNKLWKHLLTFLLIPLFLLNFILFDMRHDFRMAQAIISTGKSSHFFIPFSSWMENRINNTISLQLFEYNGNNLFSLAIFVLVLVLTIVQIKTSKKYRQIYSLFLFYYFGYMVMSFVNKGVLLFHYMYLIVPLTTLWLVSFLDTTYEIKTNLVKSKLWKTQLFNTSLKDLYHWSLKNANRIIIVPLITYLYITSLQGAQTYIDAKKINFMNKNYNSWTALSAVAKEVITEQKGKEFGYYVFAPDAFAYQPRYAMIYNFKASRAKALEYVKKTTTYIIAAPPPANDIYMTHVWWRKVPVAISKEPIKTKKFPSGFTVEKFTLTKEEQQIPHSKSIELGIHFR